MVRNILNYILSLSLIWTPYAFGTEASSNIEQSKVIKQFVDQFSSVDSVEGENKKIQEAVSVVEDIHSAMMDGNLNQYLSQNKDLKDKFDSLLIGNQIATFYDSNNTIYKKIEFDTQEHISKFSDRILDIDVKFDRGFLLLEGVVISEDKEQNIQKHFSVTQKIKHIREENVLDFAYDKEILSILYKTQYGIQLILYHIPYAKELIGGSPIPAAVSYLDVPEDLVDKIKKFKLHFINSESNALTDPSEYPIQNSKQEALFQLGDLVIVYEHGKHTKFADLKTRKGLYEMMREMYENLDLLLEIRQSSNHLEKILEIHKEKEHLGEHSPSQFIYDLINGLFNGKTLDSLNQYRSQYSYLSTHYLPYIKDATDKNEILTFEAWNKEQPTAEEAAEKKHSKLKKLLQKIGISDKSSEKTSEFLSEYKFDLLVAATGAALALWQFSTFTGLDSSPAMSAMHSMVLLGVGLLGMVYGLAPTFIPLLKFINKHIPEIQPEKTKHTSETQSEKTKNISETQPEESNSFKLSIQKKSNSFKLSIQKTIQKWGGEKGSQNADAKTLLSGLGFKAVAVLAPIFKRIFQLTGFSTLHYGLTHNLGLDSLRTVKKDSSLGKSLKLKEDLKMRVPFKQKRAKIEVLDAKVQRNSRVDHLARIMTYYSLLDAPAFDLSKQWIGTLDIDIPQLIEKRGGEAQFLLDFNWIQKKLKKYILKFPPKNIFSDVFQWDTEVLNNYYSFAQNLNTKSKKITSIQKGASRLGSNAGQFLTTEILNWNSAQADRLSNITPNPTITNQFSVGLIIDHIIMVTAPLTFLTPRGADNYSLGVDSYRFFNSSSPHLVEVALNIAAHIRGTAQNQLTDQSGLENELLNSLMKRSEINYKATSEQLPEKISTANYWLSSFKYPFQFGGKINEGTAVEERIDAGHFFWNNIKNQARFIFIGLSITLLAREFFTAHGIDISLLGSLYFAAGGFIYFGWPQIWSFMHNQSIEKRLTTNKENIDLILSIQQKIDKNLYSQGSKYKEQDIRNAFKSFRSLYQHFGQYHSTTVSSKFLGRQHKKKILEHFKDIEHSKKFMRRRYIESKVEADAVLDEVMNESNMNEKKEHSKKFIRYVESKIDADILLDEIMKELNMNEKKELVKRIYLTVVNTDENPNSIAKYFPNTPNRRALSWHLLVTLGIFSNLAFVYLSVDSFDPSKITIGNILTLAGLTYGGLFGYNLLLSKSLTERKEAIKRTIARWTGQSIETGLFKNPLEKEKKIVDSLLKGGVKTMKKLKTLSAKEMESISGVGKGEVEIIKEALLAPSPNIIDKCMSVFKN